MHHALVHMAVTGATGFVGRNLVAHLLREGHSVTAVSRRPASVAGIACVSVPEFRQEAALRSAFARCQVVVHLAARAHVLQETSPAEAAASFRSANLEVSESVAIAARAAGVRRLVFISSIGVHGSRTSGRPFREDDPLTSTEPYAISKREAEQRVRELLSGSSTELVILRPTLVYGPGCPGNFRLLMNLVRRLPIVPLAALERPRSLMFVGNLCDAILVACLHPATAGRTYVLSDGVDTTVAHAARALASGFGRDPRCVVRVPLWALKLLAALAGRSAAVEKLAGELRVDPSAFRRDTGWTPPVPPEDALARSARMDLRDAPGIASS